jgi:hypothetical protein
MSTASLFPESQVTRTTSEKARPVPRGPDRSAFIPDALAMRERHADWRCTYALPRPGWHARAPFHDSAPLSRSGGAI